MWYALSGFALLIAVVVSYWHRIEARWRGQSGEANGVRYQWDVRNWRETAFESRIAIDGVQGFDFGLKPEYGFDRLFIALGISREMQVGHADFDRRVYIMSEDSLLRDALASSARLRGDLVALLDECSSLGVTLWSMRCQSGRLWLRLRPVSLSTTEVTPDVARLAYFLVPHLQRIASHLAHLRPERFKAVRDRYARISWMVSSIGFGLLAYGAAMFVRGGFTVPITVDRAQLFLQALLIAALVLAGLIGMTIIALGRTSRAHVILIEIVITGGIGASLAATANLRDVNMDFDSSPAQIMELAVVGKELKESMSRRRSTRYFLQLKDWTGRDDDTFNFSVGSNDYANAVAFRTRIRIKQRAGALGVRWIEEFTVLHVPSEIIEMPPPSR
jgi:hypothetical protein